MTRYLLILLASLVLFSHALTGCGPALDKAGAVVPTNAKDATTLAYNAAVLALITVDKLEAQRQDAVTAKGPEAAKAGLAKAEANTARIVRAKELLKLVRSWVDGTVDEKEGRAALRDGSALLELLATELKADGVPVPDEVLAALAFLKGFAQ